MDTAVRPVQTGKPFKLTMMTIGHCKDGVIDEEWLIWDKQAFIT